MMQYRRKLLLEYSKREYTKLLKLYESLDSHKLNRAEMHHIYKSLALSAFTIFESFVQAFLLQLCVHICHKGVKVKDLPKDIVSNLIQEKNLKGGDLLDYLYSTAKQQVLESYFRFNHFGDDQKRNGKNDEKLAQIIRIASSENTHIDKYFSSISVHEIAQLPGYDSTLTLNSKYNSLEFIVDYSKKVRHPIAHSSHRFFSDLHSFEIVIDNFVIIISNLNNSFKAITNHGVERSFDDSENQSVDVLKGMDSLLD